jgi:hypothetical protein
MLLLLGGRASYHTSQASFRFIAVPSAHWNASANDAEFESDKSLVFGCAGCGRIFASMIPSNHRKEA